MVNARWARCNPALMRSFLATWLLSTDQCIMAQHGPDPARIDADRQKLQTVVENRRNSPP